MEVGLEGEGERWGLLNKREEELREENDPTLERQYRCPQVNKSPLPVVKLNTSFLSNLFQFPVSVYSFSIFTLRSLMEVLRRQTPPPPSSTLNPYAPAFIPMAYYDVVEDFSDQWWSLVHSSPCFRDYWLRECFQDLQSDSLFPGDDDLLLDLESVFGDCLGNQEEQEKRRSEKELIAASALRWNNSKAHGRGDAPRYGEKAPKVVNVKLSPRPIQQPR